MRRGVRLLRGGVIVVVTTALLAACGGSPTSEEEQGGASRPEENAFEPVLSELEGLSGAARTDKLVELAQAEGTLSLYTSNTDAEDIASEFEDAYDIDVAVYRATADIVLSRMLQENQADFAGSDVVDANAAELLTLNQEGLLAPYDGPALDGLPQQALLDNWTATRFNLFVIARNTELIPDGEAPTTYEGLADPRYDDNIMMEPRAWDWFMTLHDYLTTQGGMSEQEADDYFRSIASGSAVITGNTVHASLLEAGEYGLSAATYHHLIEDASDEGAPVAWDPIVEPVILRPNGIGLVRTAQNPAAALLYFEWQLGPAQELYTEANRVPARESARDGTLDGVEVVYMDTDKLVSEGQEWEDRYERIIQEGQVISEEELDS